MSMDRRSFLKSLGAVAAIGSLPAAYLRSTSAAPFAVSPDDVRNVVSVSYHDELGVEGRVDARDVESIAVYGERWMGVVEGTDSRIRTARQAEALASAILADLVWPTDGADA